MKNWHWRAVVWLNFFTFLGISGCSAFAETTATMDATQAHQTVQALVTQSVASPVGGLQTPAPSPSATPSPRSDAIGTQPILSTATPRPSATPLILSPTPPCDRAAAGSPIDVTIPDDTIFLPDESFTKIWRLVNVGTCTWTRRYAARFFYGSLMDAPEVVYLAQDVFPGQVVEIAIDMVAPATPGIHQGNWKLQNADGALFGMGPSGDAPFWVRIVVVPPATPTQTLTPSPTLTPTPTATVTPTPLISAAGTVTLQNGQALDLDTGSLDSGEADDVAYQVGVEGYHVLTPKSGTIMGVFGLVEPNPESCQAAGMSEAPLALESLTAGTYLCYQTDQALYGWLRYTSLEIVLQSVSLDYHTWTSP